MKEDYLKRLAVHDCLLSLVTKKLNWVWDDKEESFFDRDGVKIRWYMYDNIVLPEPVCDEEDVAYTQVNMWGDGTLEIQDTSGESFCWDDFDLEFLREILECIK